MSANALTQGASLTRAAARWARAGMPMASPEVLAARMEQCRACEHWDAKALRGTGRCRHCGCSTAAKLRLATEKCPVGKW